MRLVVRLVVLSQCHTRSSHGRVDARSLETLAGAHCVLVSLWPVPDTALKILLRTFYSSLMQGSRASAASSEALCTIQTIKQVGHPANWASLALVGGDVHPSNQVVLMGQALVELLKTPDKCRDALRVVVHLVREEFLGLRDASSQQRPLGPAEYVAMVYDCMFWMQKNVCLARHLHHLDKALRR
ncbi:tetratricopeptide repeat protein 28-like [Dermacentor variabilis]|uniref:tetratricopeptide repeat protein 28-like n=1 Tax=Dermacentor variabilis TaxID=34621 RepID=UPI003F5BCF34